MTTELTARDTLVALLGEAKADEVIEQAARAEYASDRTAGEDWDREGAEYRELYLTPVTAALAAVLPGLLAPEVITTVEEADALPGDSVVRDMRGIVWERPGGDEDETFRWRTTDGSGRYQTFTFERFRDLPLTVLYRPKEA